MATIHPVLTLAIILATVSASVSCKSSSAIARDRVRLEIAAVIARRVQATQTRDIDAFLATIPSGLVLQDESGEKMTRAQLRANLLRDWSVIKATRRLTETIDSLSLGADTATVFTRQHWDRLMFERDRVTIDTVVTTERHRETWRRTPAGWRPYAVLELGGTITVNGKPYTH
jgi:hypothetical protein